MASLIGSFILSMNNLFLFTYFQKVRIGLYNLLSDKVNVGKAVKRQPVLTVGAGTIYFGKNVQVGFWPSPYYFNGYTHLEVRDQKAIIKFGNNVQCNNNLVIVCDGTSIEIGEGTLIGTNVEMYDSNFHGLKPGERNTGNHARSPIFIGANVFIGSNVKILKGVTIGNNTVIANSAVVTHSFPDNVVIAGNPAKIISEIQ